MVFLRPGRPAPRSACSSQAAKGFQKAARYDAAGKRTQPASLTVKHNGVLIHKDLEIQQLESTTAAHKTAGPSPEGIYLQNHGCPVRYRTIWAVEN